MLLFPFNTDKSLLFTLILSVLLSLTVTDIVLFESCLNSYLSLSVSIVVFIFSVCVSSATFSSVSLLLRTTSVPSSANWTSLSSVIFSLAQTDPMLINRNIAITINRIFDFFNIINYCPPFFKKIFCVQISY